MKNLGFIKKALTWAASRASLYRGDIDLNKGLKPFFKPAETSAAVLIPLIKRGEELHVILTQRPETMRQHAGQISFPGGKTDDDDRDIYHTALREAEEEIGLKPEQVEILGHLPAYQTRTGFEVTPVVGLVDEDFIADINPHEVDHIIELPLSHFLDDKNCRIGAFKYEGYAARYYEFEHGNRKIWGATAGMIVGFRNAIWHVQNRPSQRKCEYK